MIAKINVKVILILCFLFILRLDSFGSSIWSPSVIIGTGITKIDLSEPDNQFYYFDYSYPFGYLLGFENKINATNRIYISNSIYFKNEKAKMYFIPGARVKSPFLEYSSHYIRFSSLLGFEIINKIDFLIGYDIGKRNNITIKIFDHDGNHSERLKLSNLPKYDNSLCTGIRRNFIIKNRKYHIDIKYLFGLTEYKFGSKKMGWIANPTKNMNLQLEIGSKF